MRKHGLTRTFRATELPLWKRDIPRRISVGDNVLTIMAEAQHYQPVSVTFPEENPAITAAELDLVDDDAVSQHLVSQLPVADLLIWLQRYYSHLSDATLLRLYHAFTQQNEWSISLSEQEVTCELKRIYCSHYPLGI